MIKEMWHYLNLLGQWLKTHWGVAILSTTLLVIILISVKPGYVILGNDNFSPELNPSLALERSLNSPAFRTYRVLGLPSDSEQADIFRTGLFFVLKFILPTWIISQGYLFFTFFIASFSMASLCAMFLSQIFREKVFQKAFLLGGLFYVSSMLTSWIYYFPVQLFVAAYAFLPFVLWRLYAFYRSPSYKNAFFLLLAALFLSTSALTATLFLICAAVIVIFAIVFFALVKKFNPIRFRIFLIGLFIIFAIQSYWFFPFITYVKSNASALRDSSINREITATTIENEVKYNTPLNAIRYYASWMDTKENNVDYTFPYRNWYKESPLATAISFIPVLFAILGTWYGFKKSKLILVIFLSAFFGWWSIKGVNPPLGGVYEFFQNTFPIGAQVFRWQSSKLWPFLAVTMPVLASVGVIQLSFIIIRQFKKYGTKFATGFFISIAFFLLIFVYPYFLGGLIRQSVFNRVPIEYYQLEQYLNGHDKLSRIYLAPEANTLYFRNYSWGFWGSVVLNYILPNPIVEKALIIGSYENEQAFSVIRQAYYSQDPLRFVNALRIYNIPYVLSDKYASTGLTGYVYDWNINKKVIEDSQYLEKVWQQGKLSLYKVRSSENVKRVVSVFPQTNFARLNTIITTMQNPISYYTQSNKPGRIYPFALAFDSLNFTEGELIGKTVSKQANAIYNLSISPKAFLDTPTQVLYYSNQKKLVFYPLVPYITVNNSKYAYILPSKNYSIDALPSFVAVDGQIVDLRSNLERLKTIDTLYNNISQQKSVAYWDLDYEIKQLANDISCDTNTGAQEFSLPSDAKAKCQTQALEISKDSVVELQIGLKSTSAVQVTVCVYSDYKKACLNKNSTAFIDNASTSLLLIPSVIQSGDKLTIFVNYQSLTKNIKVSVPKIMLKIYSNSQLAKFENERKPTPSFLEVPINMNDEISFHMPVVTNGGSSWSLSPEGKFIPQSSSSLFNTTGSSEQTTVKDGSISILNRESSASIYPKLSYLDPQHGLGFLAVVGEHVSGIPADISFKGQDQSYKLWQRELYYKQETNTIDLFSLPNEVESYSLETFASGVGPRESKNIISDLAFKAIPVSWYNFVLTPKNEKLINVTPLSLRTSKDTNTYSGVAGHESGIFSIPIATSPNWRITVDNKAFNQNALLINGWQQGWLLSQSGKISVWFWPNIIAYLGFIPLVAIIGLLIWYLGRKYLKNLKLFFAKKPSQT